MLGLRTPNKLLRTEEVGRVEAIQGNLPTTDESRTQLTGFEPQILAFCCEH